MYRCWCVTLLQAGQITASCTLSPKITSRMAATPSEASRICSNIVSSVSFASLISPAKEHTPDVCVTEKFPRAWSRCTNELKKDYPLTNSHPTHSPNWKSWLGSAASAARSSVGSTTTGALPAAAPC